jgi:hypothetical protein
VVNLGPFEVVNALDFNQIEHLVELHHRRCFNGSTLSLQRKPSIWDLNMNSLFHVLNLAKAGKIKKNILLRVLPFWTNNT